MQMSIDCVSSSIQLMQKMGLEDAKHIFMNSTPLFSLLGGTKSLLGET